MTIKENYMMLVVMMKDHLKILIKNKTIINLNQKKNHRVGKDLAKNVIVFMIMRKYFKTSIPILIKR